MNFFERVRYAAYLALAIGMLVSLLLVLASADAVALLPPSVFELALSPLLMAALYLVAFIVAPTVAERFPIKRW